MQHCFPPVVRADCRLVLLGSLPGAVSLSQGRYYAHPRNQFWRLVGAVIGSDLEALAYPDRLEALVDARIGLWDMVAAANREGSGDSAIRLHEASDLEGLVGRLPKLRGLGFNGATAARIGRRQMGVGSDLPLIDLPSSSPAHTQGFERKLQSWLKLRDILSG